MGKLEAFLKGYPNIRQEWHWALQLFNCDTCSETLV